MIWGNTVGKEDSALAHASKQATGKGRKTTWTKEEVIKEALKYKTRTEFKSKKRLAYFAAIDLGVFEDATSHMRGVWTVKTLNEEARKYGYRGDFRNGSPGAYMKATRLGILDDICTHMAVKKSGYKKWTDELIMIEAKKYKTKGEFCRNAPGAYTSASLRGLINKFCSHMEFGGTKWNDKKVIEEAKKYKTLSDFSAGSPSAYVTCMRNKIKDKACGHMVRMKRRSDTVYIWRLGSIHRNDLYKVGICSSKRKLKYRAVDVSKSLGVSIDCYVEFCVGELVAEKIESILLKNLVKCDELNGKGSTEIVILTKQELESTIGFIEGINEYARASK